jgi:hypothetical protein
MQDYGEENKSLMKDIHAQFFINEFIQMQWIDYRM